MDFSSQLEFLDKTFLSEVTTQFPNELDEREKTITHACLVLSHAVIEEELEAVFSRYFERLLNWSTCSIVPASVVGFAFATGLWAGNIDAGYKRRNTGGLLGSQVVSREFDKVIRSNNGVSPTNILGMAKLTGLDWPSFEAALSSQLGDLQTLSAKRGEAGHLSPFTGNSWGLSWQDYPDDVREWIGSGRDAVIAIDEYLQVSFYRG